MNATDFAIGLRQIADWYEAHQEVKLPELKLSVYTETETPQRAAELVRMLGSVTKEMEPSFFVLTRSFNGIALRFAFYRSTLCTRRVVGTRLIPAQPARPEREEEIVEWDCHAILQEVP